MHTRMGPGPVSGICVMYIDMYTQSIMYVGHKKNFAIKVNAQIAHAHMLYTVGQSIHKCEYYPWNRVIDMCDQRNIKLKAALEQCGYSGFRGEQKTVVEGYMDNRDVFFCSPTGSGKSLCFEIAPFLFEDKAAALVISPLVSLIKTQCDKLQSKGINARYIGEEVKDDCNFEDLKCGKYDILFASPESLVPKGFDVISESHIKVIIHFFYFLLNSLNLSYTVTTTYFSGVL